MEDRQEPYKVELIKDLPEDAEISFYRPPVLIHVMLYDDKLLIRFHHSQLKY